MNLTTAISDRIRTAQPEILFSPHQVNDAPSQLTCHLHLGEPGRLVADITGPSFIEASDAAVPVIDALFSTDVTNSDSTVSASQGSVSKTRVTYAHGFILRNSEGKPIGYRCIFNHEAVEIVSHNSVASFSVAEAA